MEIDEKIRILRSVPLFSDLPPEKLKLIIPHLHNTRIPQNTVFIEQDEISNDVYFIISGAARVYRMAEDGKEVQIATRGPGDVVGEMALLDTMPRSASVKTMQETDAFVLPGKEFETIIETNPDIALTLLRTLSMRIRENVHNIETISSKTLEERTIDVLQTLSSYFPNREITMSQEELSLIFGATRARVTEVLNKLKTDRKIDLEHRKITLL